MAQPLVLAIEPDLRQAAIVKRIVREKALADVAVVDSRDAAIEAMRTSMPDVLLLSALLSPRDEDELMVHLRTLEHAGHLQTHTIPQLASALGPGEGRVSRGLLSAFRRKKEPEPPPSGCDPDLFAEEIRVFIQRATDKKRQLLESTEPVLDVRGSLEASRPIVVTAIQTEQPPSSSWSSPFEWKPSISPRPHDEPTPAHGAAVAPPESAVQVPEPVQTIETVAASAPVAPIAPPEMALPFAAVEPAPAVRDEPGPLPSPGELVWPAEARAEDVAAVPFEDAVAQAERAPEDPLVMAFGSVTAPAVDEAAAVVMVPEAPVTVAAVEPVVIELDASLAAATHKPVQERAEEIVARVQESIPRTPAAQPANEWTRPATTERRTDVLGPLARWARSEPVRKPAPAAVTADDVRALIASLGVPPAVASVTYPRGCRIRRVRVPAAQDSEPSETFGAVIVSRRLLEEQREKRPSA